MELTERIEAYLNGEMPEEESRAFEKLRAENPALDQQIVAHKAFLDTLSNYGKRKSLISAMNSIHDEMDIRAVKAEALPTSTLIRVLWNKYKMNAAVAASVAILAVFTSLLSTGYFSKINASKSDYNALRRVVAREIGKVKQSQNEILQNIHTAPSNPGLFGATGFALTEDGYLVTNHHVIEGADSVYIQNTAGESYKVKTVHVNPAYDIAILKIIDPDFKSFSSLPYTFKKSVADLGENVYTIGFPKDDYVLGTGYLSSRTGYNGDTVQYQIDIPLNNGNSGGPLLDNKGNVIGVISGKQMHADGASFAIKSKYLLEAIDSISETELGGEISINKKNSLAGLNRKDQIKKLQNYIFMVKVY